MDRIIIILFTVTLCITCSQSEPFFQKNIVWDIGEEGVNEYRIPGIVATTKGTVLAFAESRVEQGDEAPKHVVMKRSIDGGITWSSTIYIEQSNGNFWAAHQQMIDPADVSDKKEVWTNVAPIVDQSTGRIFFFYALSEGAISGNNTQRYTRVFYKYSDDDGLTWSDRVEISDLLKAKKDGTPNVDDQGNWITDINGFPCDYLGRAFHMPGPGHGIQLSSGRLLLQLWNRTALGALNKDHTIVPIPISERKYGICTIYSDDHGNTWKYGSSFGENLHMNESRMVELENGDVYVNSRYTVEGKNAYRTIAISHDGGIHWVNERIDEGFPFTNQCDGGVVRLTNSKAGKTRLLYCKNESPEGRTNLTVRVSYDEGQTWQVGKTVDKGVSLYSDLTVLPDKTILVLYETGINKPLYCARLNIEWLTDGNDSIETDMIPPIPAAKGLGGETRPSVRTSEITVASLQPDVKNNFRLLDYIALIGYLIFITWLGYYFSSKNKSSKDFFLGGQKIPFWAAGLSTMAAQVSAIGFMSIPAKSFATDWSYFAGSLTWFVVVPIIIYAFVPFYRRLNVTSAYEYLERRFNKFIRSFIAALYLLFQLLGRMGAVIFLPSLALSAVTGMNIILCIVIIGGLSTLYTVLGGMHAMIWIDVIQSLVMFGAIFLCIGYIIMNVDGGIGEIIQVANADGKFSFGRLDWDLTSAVIWVIVIGNIFNRIGGMATDQSVVQRYLTTRNEKENAKALWTDALVSIPWALCVFGLGTALYVFYKLNPDLMSPTLTNDEIVPFFIGQNLPMGISGIVIAGIFAASMSSVDGSIHSSTTVIMRDFMQRFMANTSEKRKVSLARWITTIIGLLGTSIALVMTFFDINSVWDIVLEFAGLFTGAMTGVFILGIFSTRANGKGAIAGAVISASILLLVKTFTPLHFFLYSGIGIVSCVIIGYLASLFFKSSKSTEGLTIYSVDINKV